MSQRRQWLSTRFLGASPSGGSICRVPLLVPILASAITVTVFNYFNWVFWQQLLGAIGAGVLVALIFQVALTRYQRRVQP